MILAKKFVHHRTFLSLIFLIFSFSIFAQNTVKGIVIDEETEKPIAGATVEIENTSFKVQTDEDGTFEIFIPEIGTGFRVIYGNRKQLFALTEKSEVTLFLPKVTTKNKSSLLVGKNLKGRVIHSDSGMPIAGAHVSIVKTVFQTQTNADGEFLLYIPHGGNELKIEYGKWKKVFEIGEKEEQLFSLGARDSQKNKRTAIAGKTDKTQTSPEVLITENDFKKGNLYNPVQLIQGIGAGLIIARPGDDPNENFDIRLRGFHSFSQRMQPLIVIDGLPDASLASIDPTDIASFKILKDAAASAKYGIRGNSGVIEITTKTARDTAFRINYHGYFASEVYARRIPVLSAFEFSELGGSDNGGNFDWLEEITRNAASAASSLSFSGGKKLKYYGSLHYRNVNGILKNSGYETYGARVNLNYKTFRDRLQIGLLLGGTNQDINYSFNEAFRYVTNLNPTVPIRSDAPFFEQFGGYFVTQQFDVFNPVALLEQNVNEGTLKTYSGTINGSFKITDGLHISSLYARQLHDGFFGRYFPSNAQFRGFFKNGEAQTGEQEIQNSRWETALTFEKTIGDFKTSLRSGYDFQQLKGEGLFYTGEDFGINPSGYRGLTLANVTSRTSTQNTHDLSAYFGEISVNYDDFFFVNGTFRREGSSRLGSDNKWGNFYGIGAAIHMSEFFKSDFIEFWKLRASFGRTGGAPGAGFLSKQIISRGGTVFFNGEFVPGFDIQTNSNPALTFEQKTEFNFGIDFGIAGNRVQGSLDFFDSKTEDVIQNVFVPSPPNIANRTWLNTATVANSGIELSLWYQLINFKNFGWSGNFQFTKFRTTVEKWRVSEEEMTFPGAPGFGASFLVKVEEGESLGNLQGFEFIGFDPQGGERFKDLNQDNIFCFCSDDRTIIGNGIPNSFIGLGQKIRYENFELDFFIRGAFGHELFNLPRLFYEAPIQVSNNLNVVNTEFFEPTQNGFNSPSDRFVEGAGYLKWDYISLAYDFNFEKLNAVKNLKIYFTLQNPIINTDYSGADPEVRLKDPGTTSNGNIDEAPLNYASLGIDRRSTYLPMKGWIFGLRLGF